ncbi:unnamed protein product [Allacma fusca]|uniref:Uncharacterized protein n=1 Tax=Allacma fusca TaxID=39272 RepID=A0A8J2LIG4_9HEXA|nr:unnamed protein product [Allacma fusca]
MSCTVKKLSIVTLMGLPGSGKTTLAGKIRAAFEEKNLAKNLRKNFVSCVNYLASTLLNKEGNSDLTLSGDTDDVINGNKFVEKAQQTLLELTRESCAYENGFIVVDDNNYYRSMRNDFYQVAKSLECSYCVLYVKCSADVSKQRNVNRPVECQVKDEVIDDMSSRLEEPDPMNNPCDLFCIQYPTDGDIGEEFDLSVKTLLEHSLLNPVIYQPPPDRSGDRRVCSENEIHQADLVLRKWINSQLVISSFTGKQSSVSRKNYSQELNTKKSLVLKKLKSGEYKTIADATQDVEFSREIISLVKITDCNGS